GRRAGPGPGRGTRCGTRRRSSGLLARIDDRRTVPGGAGLFRPWDTGIRPDRIDRAYPGALVLPRAGALLGVTGVRDVQGGERQVEFLFDLLHGASECRCRREPGVGLLGHAAPQDLLE